MWQRLTWCVVMVGLLLATGCRRPPQEEAPKPLVVAPQAAPFALQMDTPEVSVVQGAKAKVKVSVTRKGYPGPITLELKNLPGQVSANSGLIPPEANGAEIDILAANDAAPGKSASAQVVATATIGGQKVTSPNLVVAVLEVPYTLRVEGPVVVQQGSRASVKVQAVRKTYQGPITLEVRNLPGEIKPGKAALAQGQSTAEIEITATPKALEGDRAGVQVVGSGANYQGISPSFAVSIVGLPFSVQTDPDVMVPYGVGKATLKVSVQRRDYKGPIALELQGLPAKVTAASVQIPEGKNSAEVEIVAAENAPSSKNVKAHVVGTALAAVHRQATSGKFNVTVEPPPFDLRLEPSLLSLSQGARVPWKVVVVRRGYDGPIKIELKNLPKEITTGAVTLPRGQNSGTFEIVVEDEAPGGDKTGIQAIGTALTLDNKKVAASNLVLKILEPFSLKVEPKSLQLVEGTKATFKVNVERRTYDGPIDVAVRNLPAQIMAPKITIAEGKNEAEIELAAATPATGAARKDVQVFGTYAGNRKVFSPAFEVALQSKLFDLKVRPEFIAMPVGDKATLKVMATRRNYQGPIAVELRNLPALVTGSKSTIPAGQNEIDVEVAASQDAVPGNKTDLQVLGTATAGGNQQVASPSFRLDLKPGLFDLKVEPALLKLNHGASSKLKVVALRKGFKGAINVELKGLPKEVKAPLAVIAADKSDIVIDVKAEFAAAEGDTVDVQAKGYASLGEKHILSPRFTVSVISYGQPAALEVKVDQPSLKIATGGTAKIKVTLARKMHDGPVSVELKNLPLGLESSRATIEKGQNTGEVTLTAKTNAELGMRSDICAVATAAMQDGPHHFASPQLTLQVLKK